MNNILKIFSTQYQQYFIQEPLGTHIEAETEMAAIL